MLDIESTIKDFLSDLGDSLSYWTSYISSVKRGTILQESAIRYAVSEFLEVNKHNEENGPVVKSYHFEMDHPYYDSKSTDLFFKLDIPYPDSVQDLFSPPENNTDGIWHRKEINISIEFKYVRSEARPTNGIEFQRYVHDLCRLYSISSTDNDNSKCYFVVVGNFESFYDNFCSIIERKRGRKKKGYENNTEETQRTYRPKGQYARFLPFVYNKVASIELSNYSFIKKALDSINVTSSSGKKDLTFKKRELEKVNELRQDKYSLQPIPYENIKYEEDDTKIRTKLVYSNLYSKRPEKLHPDVCVCVWEILSN